MYLGYNDVPGTENSYETPKRLKHRIPSKTHYCRLLYAYYNHTYERTLGLQTYYEHLIEIFMDYKPSIKC